MPYNIPVLFGNTRYRDHQFFPCPDRSVFTTVVGEEAGSLPFNVNATDNWASALSLEQIMAITWRVKNWKLGGTWAASVEGEWSGDSLIHHADFTTTIDDTTSFVEWTGGSANEKQKMHFPLPLGLRRSLPRYGGDTGRTLACSGLYTVTCNVTTVITDDTPDVALSPDTRTDRGQVDASIAMDYSIRARDCVVWDAPAVPGDPGFFSPCIALLGGMTFDHISAFVILRAPTGDGNEAAGTLVVSPGVASPFTIPLTVHAIYTIGAVSTTLISASAALTLTPYDFFAYKNRLGQPIYDTATGAQINDPFA